MFYTVFNTDPSSGTQWQSDLLEFSWKRVKQDGELVRLVATDDPSNLPVQEHARCVATTRCDDGPVCSKPASLLEWVYRDSPEGTVLLLDLDCIFVEPVSRRAAPGFPLARSWIDLKLDEPSCESPFGLGAKFSFLNDSCARTDLSLAPVLGPVLIHTRDLRRISARWFELCRLMHRHFGDEEKYFDQPVDQLAYLVACAEYNLRHESAVLGTEVGSRAGNDTPIVCFNNPAVDDDGKSIFDKRTYEPWSRIDPRFETKHKHDLIALINDYVDKQISIEAPTPAGSRPRRSEGIMEGRVLDELLLERPSDGAKLWLNSSGKAIWELCDGSRTIEDIAVELGTRYSVNHRTVLPEACTLVGQLQNIDFIELG